MPKHFSDRSADEKQQITDAAMLMRYRTTDVHQATRRYASYKMIAHVLGVTVGQVQHLCMYRLKRRDEPVKEQNEAKVL